MNVIHTVLGLVTLSTDHAASSYGQPVIVSPADGSGLGVADAPGTCAPAPGETDTGDLCGKWNYANALFGAGRTAERRERAAVARAGRGNANAAAARENGKKGGRPKKNSVPLL